MKKLLLLSAIALVATSASAVEVKPYMEGKVNYNWLKAEYKEAGLDSESMKDNVLGGALEVGAKINQFRVGLEGYYNDKIKDKLVGIIPVEGETKGFFLNGYWDIPLGEPKNVKPFIGAGIGYSWLKETAKLASFGLENENAKDKSWGWNVGLGVGYALTENIDLSLGYRYEYLGKIKENGSKTEFYNSKVSLGLRYTF